MAVEAGRCDSSSSTGCNIVVARVGVRGQPAKYMDPYPPPIHIREPPLPTLPLLPASPS